MSTSKTSKVKQQQQRQQPSFWIHFAAGGVGGTVGAAITCPLEVVKTRLQSSLYKQQQQNNISFRNPIRAVWSHMVGTVHILKEVKNKEGVRALWKGLGPTLIGVVPARAIYFAVYSRGKHIFTQYNNGIESSTVHMLSAALAGSVTGVATNPIWLVKTRMQLQSQNPDLKIENRYRNSFHCIQMVLKEEGVRGLYKGLSASLLGISESTVQFVLYEKLKRVLIERRRSREASIHWKKSIEPDRSVHTSSIIKQKSPQEWIDTFVAAAIAKLCAAGLTYPHEVLRTRLRQSPELADGKSKYTSLIQASKLIYKEEGLIALYGGMTAHLMRVVPNAAIMLFCYEAVVAAFQ